MQVINKQRKTLIFFQKKRDVKIEGYGATRLLLDGLKDRGEIAEGKAADVVVFNPETVTDRATLDKSRSAPIGITHVLVNGKVVVRSIQ